MVALALALGGLNAFVMADGMAAEPAMPGLAIAVLPLAGTLAVAILAGRSILTAVAAGVVGSAAGYLLALVLSLLLVIGSFW